MKAEEWVENAAILTFPRTELTTLYDGKELLAFETVGHKYFWSDKRIPGATSILGLLAKPMLVPWAVGCAIDKMKELQGASGAMPHTEMAFETKLEEARNAHKVTRDAAANVGTKIHAWLNEWVENDSNDITIKSDHQIQDGMDNLFAWLSKVTDKFIASERIVLSCENEFAGTMDLLTEKGRTQYVDDLKTGNTVGTFRKRGGFKIYESIRFQLAAYVGALIEEGILDASRPIKRRVLHLPQKTGKLQVHTLDKDWQEDYIAFCNLREVYRVMRGY